MPLPPPIQTCTKVLMEAGLRAADYGSVGASLHEDFPYWSLPPLLGWQLGSKGYGPRQSFYAGKARMSSKVVDSALGAYRYFIQSENPGASMLVHFDALLGEFLDEHARVYFTPGHDHDIDRGFPLGAVTACELLVYLHEIFGVEISAYGNTFCAKVNGLWIGIEDGKVLGCDKWPTITADQLIAILHQPRSLPWTGLRLDAIRLRNLMYLNAADVADATWYDGVLGLYGSYTRKPIMGGLSEESMVPWDILSREADVMMAALFTVKNPSFAEESPVHTYQRAKRKTEMLAFDDAIEAMLADLPDSHRVNTVRAILVPQFLTDTQFNRRLFGLEEKLPPFFTKMQMERALTWLQVARAKQERLLAIKSKIRNRR